MSFLWPQALWLLLAAPALIALYIVLLRRKKKNALRYASLGLVREAVGPGHRFRRHVPPLLFLLAMIALIVAVARPSATITLPSEQRTIILAIDVSLSMRANDVEPSRIAAAREAAKEFVREQPSDVRIGIVSFAGSASVVQKPTRDRDELVTAIDRLQLQLHTAIGSGIIMSLATLFPDEGLELGIADFGIAPLRDGTRAKSLDRPRRCRSGGRIASCRSAALNVAPSMACCTNRAGAYNDGVIGPSLLLLDCSKEASCLVSIAPPTPRKASSPDSSRPSTNRR